MPFIDEAKIFVKGGAGGDGCNSMYRDKLNRWGKPDGGPGGKGGDVIIAGSTHVQTLLDFYYNRHFRAPKGARGGSNNKAGRNGEDLLINVPPGTTIRDIQTGLVLREIANAGDSVVISKGGKGGRGNSRGREAVQGEAVEEWEIKLELRLIADIGLLGYPNAGKSTLISKISNARPKIANYPFTTKEPVLGVAKLFGEEHVIVADIPGLIEGAHAGRGLGDRFLRHIERTKVLVHMIDISAQEGRSPIEDFRRLNRELALYSAALARKPQIIALNKIDLESASGRVDEFRKYVRKKVYPISAITGVGLKDLLVAAHKKLRSKRMK
ncbi:MAG: GTPase ObgE [Candidatus Omnitrophota bacterium]